MALDLQNSIVFLCSSAFFLLNDHAMFNAKLASWGLLLVSSVSVVGFFIPYLLTVHAVE